jgi:hypothetical protein
VCSDEGWNCVADCMEDAGPIDAGPWGDAEVLDASPVDAGSGGN